MKTFEYLGVGLSIIAYIAIVSGNVLLGFTIGICASFMLAVYFIDIESMPSLGLQFFFICANMYGIVRLESIL